MPKKRSVQIKVEFEGKGGSLQMYLPALTTSEAIDKLLEEISFRKMPLKIGTIKESKINAMGFIQSGVE